MQFAACGSRSSRSRSPRSAIRRASSCRLSSSSTSCRSRSSPSASGTQANYYNLEPPLVALVLGLVISNLDRPAALARCRLPRRVLRQDRHRAARRDAAVHADHLGRAGRDPAGLDRLDRDVPRDLLSSARGSASTGGWRRRSAPAARSAASPPRSPSPARSARRRSMRRSRSRWSSSGRS